MKFILWVLVNAAGLAIAAWLLDGITVTGDTRQDKVLTVLAMAAIFGLVNAIIGTIVKLLMLPAIILSLGLVILVINAAMFMLSSKIAEHLDLGWHVDKFWWTAVLGSLITAIATSLIQIVVPKK